MNRKENNQIDDFAERLASNAVRLQRLLPGTIEEVWEYLTDGELRKTWLAAGHIPLVRGERFTLSWRNDELTDPPGTPPPGVSGSHQLECEVVDVEPPTKLSFTWGPGLVTFSLTHAGHGEVVLTVLHESISDGENVIRVSAGWHTHLDILRDIRTCSKSSPFWESFVANRDHYQRRASSFTLTGDAT